MNDAFPVPQAPVRKKRRWWLYLLVTFGVLVCLAILTLVFLVGYYHSAVRKYTAAAPGPIPKVAFDPERHKELQNRFVEFADALKKRQSPSPLVITADDINLLISQDKGLRDRLGVVITNNQLHAVLSFPIGQNGPKGLHGRYFNGVAKVKLALEDGWPSVSVDSVDANGNRVPGWMVKYLNTEIGKQIQRNLDKNRDAVNQFHELNNVRILDNRIVITPL